MPNTREKLIEWLNSLQDYGIKRTPWLALPGLPCNEMIADHLIANGVTVQEWFSGNEKPKDDGEYIVYFAGEKSTTTLRYANDLSSVSRDFIGKNYPGWYYPDGGDGTWVADAPDYWSPMPKPPIDMRRMFENVTIDGLRSFREKTKPPKGE